MQITKELVIDSMVKGYIEGICYVECTEDAFVGYTELIPTDEAKKVSIDNVTRFYNMAKDDIDRYAEILSNYKGQSITEAYQTIGCDMWLSSQGSVLGFSDRYLDSDIEARLTTASEYFEAYCVTQCHQNYFTIEAI